MDNMAYLQQIAAKPQNSAGPTDLFSKLFTKKNLIIGGIVIAVIVVLIIGAAIIKAVTPKNSVNDSLGHSITRGQNIQTTIKTYSPNLKSSDLRTMASTLNSVLEAANANLTPFLPKSSKKKDTPSISSSVTKEEEKNLTKLTETLETARLNALLDRTFVREITLQIAIYRSYLTETSARTDKSNLKTAISSILSDLDLVYTSFQNFSDKTN